MKIVDYKNTLFTKGDRVEIPLKGTIVRVMSGGNNCDNIYTIWIDYLEQAYEVEDFVQMTKVKP